MKILLQNEYEKTIIDSEKVNMIQKIVGDDIDIQLIIINNISEKIESLSWNMGERRFSGRDNIYDR